MVYFVLQHKCWIKIQETSLAYIHKYKTNKKIASMVKKLYQYLWIVSLSEHRERQRETTVHVLF